MKTTILLSFFVLFSASVLQAQIEKGKVQLGGNISFNHNDYTNSANNVIGKSTSFNVSPSVGVFYKTNKLYGAFLNFSYNESKFNSPSLDRNYGGGIFFRQYQPVAKKLYLLFDERGSYNYGSGNANPGLYHSNSINASVQPGMAYDIAKKMQLELLLNNLFYAGYYNSTQGNTYNIGTSLNSLALSNIGLGFRFYLK